MAPESTKPLVISPSDAHLQLGDEQLFTSSARATWSLVEGGVAGTIDADGRFLAGATPGVYHVTATAKADASLTTTIAVAVGPSQLERAYGTLSGTGYADGVGAQARFNWTTGMTGDGEHTLYVVDTHSVSGTDSTLRAVDIETGAVTTVASLQNARTVEGSSPIVFAPPQTIFAVALQRSLVRVDLATGISTPFVGDSLAPAASIDGIGTAARFTAVHALAGDGSSLLVGDGDLLRKVDIATGAVTTVATLTSPEGQAGVGIALSVAYAGDKQFYVVDTVHEDATNSTLSYLHIFDSVTRQFTKTEVLAPCEGFLCRPTVAATGNLILVENARWFFQVVADDPGPVFPSFAMGMGLLDNSLIGHPSLFCASRNHCYVAFSTKVMAVDFALDYQTKTIAGVEDIFPDNGTGFSKSNRVTSVASSPSGAIFAGTNRVSADGVATALLTSAFPARAIAIDSADRLFATTGAKLLVVAADATTPVDANGAQILSIPNDDLTSLCADDAGHLYGTVGSDLVRIDVADSRELIPVTPSKFPLATAIACDKNRIVYVATASAIERVDVTSGATAAVANGFGSLSAIALADNARILYVADQADATVRVVDLRTNTVKPLLGQPGVAGVRLGEMPASLNSPVALAFTPSGDLLIADKGENVVLRTRR